MIAAERACLAIPKAPLGPAWLLVMGSLVLAGCGGGPAAGAGASPHDAGASMTPIATGDGGGSSSLLGDSGGVVSPDGASGSGCTIGTLGLPGTWGQGDVFTDWLKSQGESSSGSLGDAVITPSLLSPFEILVAQDLSSNHPYSTSEAAALKDWLVAGGGLIALIGYRGAITPPEPSHVNTLLAAYDMHYGVDPILPGSGTVPITSWVHPHPVTQGITEVGVDNGFEVQGAGTMLASQNGYQCLEVQTVGAGHIVMWCDEWITYDSLWQTHPEYQVQAFWQNIVNWLDPTGDCKVPMPVQ